VSLHCNLDDNTRHLINKERLAMMKPDAVLVNAARGPCIDEAALVKHMQEHPNFRAGGGFGINLVTPAMFLTCSKLLSTGKEFA
jgi:hypothetical protein